MDRKSAIWLYCNYQERSHKEVRNKLYELGCRTFEVDQLMAELIEAGLLNEERYARALARGKFRLKQWGKIKIIHHLKLQNVSAYCIRKALTEIDDEEYLQVLHKLALRKWTELRSDRNLLTRKAKLFRYLLQKGFESDLINDTFKEIIDAQ
jgi:regulatory protein